MPVNTCEKSRSHLIITRWYLNLVIKTKYWVLLGIMPLFVGVLIGMSFQTYDAEAITAKGSQGLTSPKSYGSATSGIVCGDRLCSEIGTPSASMPSVLEVIDADMPSYMPTMDFKETYGFHNDADDTYAIRFGFTAGDRDLKNIIIECKSDVFTHEIVIANLKAFESAAGFSRIKALDPASITGSIVAFELAG